MEDYEPVEEVESNMEEEKEEEEEKPAEQPEPEVEVTDMVQLPVMPAQGQIDYYRTVEEAQSWM